MAWHKGSDMHAAAGCVIRDEPDTQSGMIPDTETGMKADTQSGT